MRTAVLDIGGTAIKAGIFEDGSLSGLKEFETNAAFGGEHVMQSAVRILQEYGEFARIGVSTAGQVDTQKGRIKYANANIPGYTGMEIRDRLEEQFHVPVTVENDVNAAAIGEAHFGAGRQYDDFLCLTYGTGVGGAIVIGGEVYHGSGYCAGEVGALLIHPEERDAIADKFSGCYEKYASTTALVKRAMQKDASLCDGRKIFAAMEKEEIREVIDAWIDEIVYGLASLVHIFNPPCIILGGGVMKQNYIIEQLQKKLYREIMESYRSVKLFSAELGNQAGLFGAAWLADRGAG